MSRQILQKVKKFFNTPSSSGRKEHSEDGDGPNSRHSYKSSRVADDDGPHRVPSSLRSPHTIHSPRGSVASSAIEQSQGSRSVLPPVQVNSAFSNPHTISTSSTSPTPAAKQQAAIVVANILAPTQNGRRKSTPAALDMALRTAEGKAAIEELTNPNGKKQMVFGQYFGGNNNPNASTGQAPAAPASSAAARGPEKPLYGAPYKVPAIDKSVKTIMEDEDFTQSPKAVSAPVIPDTSSTPAVHAGAISSEHPAGAGPSRQAHKPQKEEASPQGPPTKLLAISPTLPAGMSRQYWSLSDYTITRKMYKGYASTVYQATCKKSLEQVALKVYHMENLCDLNHYQVYREISIHAGLQHQNIIQLFCAFQEGTDVVLVQEYAEGGDLYRLLHKNGGRLSERQAVEMVLHPFLLALHYLHTRGIMHRDIKPENVLFTEHRVLKLADFGLAIDLNEERAVTRAGTLDYMAPEVLRCPPKNLPQENKNNAALHYNNSVDAWAVGVFAYELVVGLPPFAGESQMDSVDKIIHSTPEFPEKISELAKSFISHALKKHPGDRPTVMEMIHHPWIRTYQRRTSVYYPTATRRRSSMSYGTPAGVMMPGQVPIPNLNNYTPEQIEDMISQLKVAQMHQQQMQFHMPPGP